MCLCLWYCVQNNNYYKICNLLPFKMIVLMYSKITLWYSMTKLPENHVWSNIQMILPLRQGCFYRDF